MRDVRLAGLAVLAAVAESEIRTRSTSATSAAAGIAEVSGELRYFRHAREAADRALVICASSISHFAGRVSRADDSRLVAVRVEQRRGPGADWRARLSPRA
jgi:hypothetical protein